MAIGVDTSKWKPRKIKGTPAARTRNILGVGILTFGILSGIFFHNSSLTYNLRKASEKLYEDPIEEVERRQMIASGLGNRSSTTVKKLMDEENNPNNLLNKSCQVISKYFTNEPLMDESLSDFQEKKKSSTGPKNSKNGVTKPKKVKRIRGQKDIRSALKSKKNELITYAKDFDNVCKKSGIDVDSEQLQLAIALSKSLQTESSDDTKITTNSNSQERTNKIRTTLLEYGFKVPEIKVASTKRLKSRKHYKLLLASDTERKQAVFDKYSQVLFQNLNNEKLLDHCDNCNCELYNKATNVTYDKLKDINIFYIDNLLEKSPMNTGCLLRDWSSIPGRPLSPTLSEQTKMNFSEIDCSQDELDVVLSGSLKSARDILKTKYALVFHNKKYSTTTQIKENNAADNTEKVVADDKDNVIELERKECNSNIINNVCASSSDTQLCRSYSPDIFDDEEPSGIEIYYDDISGNVSKNKETTQESPTKGCYLSKNLTKFKNDFMDLTECVHDNLISNSKAKCDRFVSQLSQKSNVTKRKSNDFMEITDCVPNSSQSIIITNDVNIDITQRFDNNDIELKNNTNINSNGNVILIIEDNAVDLTQSSNSEDELPFIKISGQVKGDDQNSLNDTIILNENDYLGINSKVEMPSPKERKKGSLNNDIKDLSSNSPQKNESCNLEYVSFYEEYVHDHSRERSKETIEDETSIICDELQNSQSENIDLTQTSDSSAEKEQDILNKTNDESIEVIDNNAFKFKVENIDLPQTVSEETKTEISIDGSKSIKTLDSLGKKDDVSIDYDDIYIDYNNTTTDNRSKSKEINLTDDNATPIDEGGATFDLTNHTTKGKSTGGSVISSSQESEVFEISDKELDYSIHKSRLEFNHNFDFGGLSVMDNFSNIRFSESIRNEDNSRVCNNLTNDSFLPVVDIKSRERSTTSNESPPTKSDESFSRTPPKHNSGDALSFQTPNNSKYIIKTDEVTPMLDYESMATPEMTRELDKYGLKPFKRKRAIQLLTHLYNQTHPVVEACEEPYPLKRMKSIITSPNKNTVSPKKTKSPRKELRNNVDSDAIYEITKELPDIKCVECNEEDWVFQKKEKAKVYSCRVPLHVAFHNYVTCRRSLKEAILRYEPVNIDVIHKGLVAHGYRYDPKDLLKFLDKKCITVKTTDNNSRNVKK